MGEAQIRDLHTVLRAFGHAVRWALISSNPVAARLGHSDRWLTFVSGWWAFAVHLGSRCRVLEWAVGRGVSQSVWLGCSWST